MKRMPCIMFECGNMVLGHDGLHVYSAIPDHYWCSYDDTTVD